MVEFLKAEETSRQSFLGKFKDIEEFNSFVLDFRNYPQINKTVTMVATLVLKEDI